jgi:hypothetical protein
MNTGHFVKVFDVLDSGFRTWTFPAFGLIFVAVGIVIFAFPTIIRMTGIPYLNIRSWSQTIFRYSFLGFAVFWTATAFLGTYSEHVRHKALAQENKCRVVEGPVEHFVPMPRSGHPVESFSVSGIPFRYSDFIVTDGFNNTSSHGGPITSDSYVRICYDPSGNVILRLEIRDFTGRPKDYARQESILSTPKNNENISGKKPAIHIPWYGNLFIFLFILDFIAIQALFIPYMRTFFRLKTTAVRDCVIPYALDVGKKIKLRNSMIYWDVKTRAIWLRPRGFNLFQMPLMAATLNIGANDKSISRYDIRFSSGAPFVMALFLWTAYVFFSAVMPANIDWPSLAPLIGISALMVLVVGFINLRILRSRMEKLVQDVLSELNEMQAS